MNIFEGLTSLVQVPGLPILLAAESKLKKTPDAVESFSFGRLIPEAPKHGRRKMWSASTQVMLSKH